MRVKFSDQCLQLSLAHLRHFPVLVDLHACQDDDDATTAVVEIGGADSALFIDLLYLNERCCHTNDVAAHWLTERMLSQHAGYIRDLFALHCFLGGGTRQDESFRTVFNRVLLQASNEEAAHFLGLRRI